MMIRLNSLKQETQTERGKKTKVILDKGEKMVLEKQ